MQNRIKRCDCRGPDGHSDTKISQIELRHISMTNDAYDIEIWHKSIWSILVSKRLSGPQQSHPSIRFCLKNCLKLKKLKNASEFFSLYKFWKSFVFSAETVMKSGHRRNHLSEILLVFLGFPDLIEWQNTRVRLGKPSWSFLARPTSPGYAQEILSTFCF